MAAHLAALHRLTTAAGGSGGGGGGGGGVGGNGGDADAVEEGGEAAVGPPARWCARVVAAAEEVLGAAMEARGNMVGGARATVRVCTYAYYLGRTRDCVRCGVLACHVLL